MGEHFAEAFDLGVVVTCDQDGFSGGDRIEFFAEFGHVAAKALDRFDVQMPDRFDRRRRQGRNGHAGKSQQLLHDRGQRKQSHWIGGAVAKCLALQLHIAGLDEKNPRFGRQVLGQVAAIKISSPLRGGRLRDCQHSRRFQLLERPLRFRCKLAERFDFIAEQFNAVWRLGVRREHVEYAAPPCEFAG